MKKSLYRNAFLKGCAVFTMLAMLALCACSGNNACTLPGSSSCLVSSVAAKGTAADTAIILDIASLKIPAGTVMKDIAGVEVTGTLTATAAISPAIDNASADSAAKADADRVLISCRPFFKPVPDGLNIPDHFVVRKMGGCSS